MAHKQRRTRQERPRGPSPHRPETGSEGTVPPIPPTAESAPDIVPRTQRDGEESVPELVRHLVDDVAALIRHEVNLAKLELRESAREAGRGLIKAGIAAAIAAVGGLALTAFLILGLGVLLGGVYWLAALIVGVVYLAIGGVLAQRAMASLRPEELKPDETLESLRQDKEFAKREAREFKRDVMS